MPSNVIDTKRDEHLWNKAEEIAEDAGKKGDYAYIMGIYKRMKPDHKFKEAMAIRVAMRYQARLKNKPSKKTLVEKAKKYIAQKAGISNTLAESIADAIVRGRDVMRLALQKNWPIDEDGLINGKLDYRDVPINA